MKRRSIKRIALLFICAISTLSATAKTTVRVAAAANLRYALSEIESEFEAAHQDIDLQINYGAAGTFYQQILSGAPYDLFLSADDLLPQRLKDSGLAEGVSAIYACGKLALYSLQTDLSTLGLKAVEQSAVERIAVANPRVAPYGTRSVELLKSLGLWTKVEQKIVYGDTIAQAAQFAMSGNCNLGFVALSLLLNPAVEIKGSYYIIPEDQYKPIVQAGIVIKEGDATKFFNYILSDECDAVWSKYGYTPN